MIASATVQLLHCLRVKSTPSLLGHFPQRKPVWTILQFFKMHMVAFDHYSPSLRSEHCSSSESNLNLHPGWAPCFSHLWNVGGITAVLSSSVALLIISYLSAYMLSWLKYWFKWWDTCQHCDQEATVVNIMSTVRIMPPMHDYSNYYDGVIIFLPSYTSSDCLDLAALCWCHCGYIHIIQFCYQNDSQDGSMWRSLPLLFHCSVNMGGQQHKYR